MTKIFFVFLSLLALCAGVAVQAITECGEIEERKPCKKSEQKFDIECYWNPQDGECVDPPTTCADIYDRRTCNKAMQLLEFEDNCVWRRHLGAVWDHSEAECIVPMECSDLEDKRMCNSYEKYPTVDVTLGGCKWNKNRARALLHSRSRCFQVSTPTSCEEILSPKQCKNAEERFGFECFYIAGECVEPPTECADIPTKALCNNAMNKLGFPCFFQSSACEEAPTTCEAMQSRNKCIDAKRDFGIAGCDFVEGECTTITCEDIEKKVPCNNSYDKYLLDCYFNKATNKCMESV